MLLAGRCVQALGGAAVVASALDLLCRGRAVGAATPRTRWARAGVLGAALGPAVGGVLTQLAGWESIFLVQAPLALAAAARARSRCAATGGRTGAPGRPHIGANLALLFGSAALSAALFLLVILLVNGWTIDPAAAGAVVTVMPLGGDRRRRASRRRRVERGCAPRTGLAPDRGRPRRASGCSPTPAGAGRSRRSCSSAPGSG